MAASIGNNSTTMSNNNNNTTNTSSFDFKGNGVILDLKKNNEKIFLNGVKLLLPKINEATTASSIIKKSVESESFASGSAISIQKAAVSLAILLETAKSEPINSSEKIKPKKIFHFKTNNTLSEKLKFFNRMVNWDENSNELNKNLMIVNNTNNRHQSIETTTNNRLPKLDQNISTHSFVSKQTNHTLNSNIILNNNNNNAGSNHFSIQAELKPVTFKLPTSYANVNKSESNLEQTRISKNFKRNEKLKTSPLDNTVKPLDEINANSLINRALEYKYFDQHISQIPNPNNNGINPINKMPKNLNNFLIPNDEPKDRRFRKKLIPITDAVKQNKTKILSVELSKPRASDDLILLEDNANQLQENSVHSFQMQQTESFLSLQSYTTPVPMPVSQITIRSMARLDVPKAVFIKPKSSPKSSIAENKLFETKPAVQGRWSPIKIFPMKSHKLFEKLKIEDYDTEKLRDLTEKFKELDSNVDGNLDFQEIDAFFCQNMKQTQRFFVQQIYNLLNESSFFGLKEFFSLYLIIEQIKRLDFRKLENYWDQFAQVDFEDYKEDIKEYIELIDSNDLKNELKIGDVIKSRNKNIKPEKFFKNSKYQINNILMLLKCVIDGEDLPTKMSNYVLLIPLFIYLECLIKNKGLLKRNTSNATNKELTKQKHYN